MINQNSEILNKLFFTELQMLVEKYNNIDEVTKKQIESIVTSLRDEELQSYLMSNMDKLLDILKCTDEIGEYLIYQDERYLKEYARDLLEDRLDQEYYVDKLFEKETVIEMWINRTTKEEMIDEIVNNENLEETLELYPQEAFSIGGIQYKYSEIQ